MAKDTFRFARIGSREEAAEYLASLGQGLKRGEVSLESGERTLHLVPAAELKIELKVKDRDEKGKIAIEIGWKRKTTARAADLAVRTTARPVPSAPPAPAQSSRNASDPRRLSPETHEPRPARRPGR